MPPSKQQVLETLSFGHRVAEDELEALQRYFVRTEPWRKLDRDEVDVIYGVSRACTPPRLPHFRGNGPA